MMNAISSLIEDQVIESRLPVNFFAGFQRFSYFPDQLRRYSRLGATCRRVYVFGVPDVRPPTIPGIEFIAVDPTSPLAREWFLVVDTPQFWTTLVTQEVDGRDQLSGGRRFDGLWSYDQRVAERASLLISQLLGDVFQPVTQRDYESQAVHIAQISGKLLAKLERARIAGRRRWAQVYTLHKVAEALVRTAKPQLLVHNLPAALLHETVQILRTIFGASAVAIVLNDQGDEYGVASVDGDDVARRSTVQRGEGLTGQAIERAEPVFVDDNVRGRDVLMPSAASLSAVPIVGQCRVYGAITVGSAVGQGWTEDDRQTLKALAGMLAMVIEQRTQAAGDGNDQNERVQKLERALVSLRRPVRELYQLNERLLSEDGLSTQQIETARYMEATLARLAQILGLQIKPLQERNANDSK